VYEAFKQID